MTTAVAAKSQVRVAMNPRRYLGDMWRRPISRAVVKALLTIWLTTSLTFFLIRLMPGSPVELKIDDLIQSSNGGLTYEDAKAIASGLFAINLNAPLHEQYISFVWNLLHLDLGTSFLSSGTGVTSIIIAVLPWTLFSVGTGLLLSFIVGIGLGLLAAYRRNSLFDRVVSTGGSLISSVPNYLIALLLILFLGVQTHLINFTSMRGAYSSGMQAGFTPAFIGDIFYHASMPIAIYFLTQIGHWILSMRSATLSALEEDYVTAARARGLSDGRIRTAYVGRNAVLPLVTQLAISVGLIVGGAAIIEQIFAYQGVGLRLLAAVTQRDYPVIQGIVMLTTIAVVVANLAADLLYSKLDPRIGRAGGSSG
jgi:peptide/nickel transport system permease protein